MVDLIASFEEAYGIEVPKRTVKCPRCSGDGRHVNPAIDEHGITGEEMIELGEDFEDAYTHGRYDVTCDECAGNTTVEEIDPERCDPDVLKDYLDYEREVYESLAVEAAERAMGA